MVCDSGGLGGFFGGCGSVFQFFFLEFLKKLIFMTDFCFFVLWNNDAMIDRGAKPSRICYETRALRLEWYAIRGCWGFFFGGCGSVIFFFFLEFLKKLIFMTDFCFFVLWINDATIDRVAKRSRICYETRALRS
jgi:hypothetical protein